jgi:hypothetical protein
VIFSVSASMTMTEFTGICLPTPWLPKPSSGGIVMRRLPPTRIPTLAR